MSSKVQRRRKLTLGRIALVLFLAFMAIEVTMLPFPWEVAKLEMVNPGLTSLMKERMTQAKAKHESHIIHESYVTLSAIPKSLVHAVIVGEDGTFYRNDGVDRHEVEQSLEADIGAMKIVRGSSTISMQLAKNLWFNNAGVTILNFESNVCYLQLRIQNPEFRI